MVYIFWKEMDIIYTQLFTAVSKGSFHIVFKIIDSRDM